MKSTNQGDGSVLKLCVTHKTNKEIADLIVSHLDIKNILAWVIILVPLDPTEKIEALKMVQERIKKTRMMYTIQMLSDDPNDILDKVQYDAIQFNSLTEDSKISEVITEEYVRTILDFKKGLVLYDQYIFIK